MSTEQLPPVEPPPFDLPRAASDGAPSEADPDDGGPPVPIGVLAAMIGEALGRAGLEALAGNPGRLLEVLDAFEEGSGQVGEHPFIKGLKAAWHVWQERQAAGADRVVAEAWAHTERAFKLAAAAKGDGLEDATILAILEQFTAPVTEEPPDRFQEIIGKLMTTSLTALASKSPCGCAEPTLQQDRSDPYGVRYPSEGVPHMANLSDYDIATSYGTVGFSPPPFPSGVVPRAYGKAGVVVGKPGEDHIIGQCFCQPCVTLERQLRKSIEAQLRGDPPHTKP